MKTYQTVGLMYHDAVLQKHPAAIKFPKQFPPSLTEMFQLGSEHNEIEGRVCLQFSRLN